ncbi:V-type proton ATPase subunit G 1 [Platanthera guangdongensis]|uniref:V-type proton ATPase subunit G 1 n=1 Tax=Platanthera guangdongensis TaxID=2320717 RepID=A0ABR2M353_9ASPA
MGTMRGQSCIQLLLAAEQEAQEIVSNARNMKLMRLKQAKDEAEREGATFRAFLEKEYQRKVSEVMYFSSPSSPILPCKLLYPSPNLGFLALCTPEIRVFGTLHSLNTGFWHFAPLKFGF